MQLLLGVLALLNRICKPILNRLRDGNRVLQRPNCLGILRVRLLQRFHRRIDLRLGTLHEVTTDVGLEKGFGLKAQINGFQQRVQFLVRVHTGNVAN